MNDLILYRFFQARVHEYPHTFSVSGVCYPSPWAHSWQRTNCTWRGTEQTPGVHYRRVLLQDDEEQQWAIGEVQEISNGSATYEYVCINEVPISNASTPTSPLLVGHWRCEYNGMFGTIVFHYPQLQGLMDDVYGAMPVRRSRCRAFPTC